MSENIVKLRVDGKDFDNNIKSARQGLLAMEQACRKVGGTLEVVEKDELDFVKALGKMETTSKSAKGKIAELTSAFTDLKAQYNRLTDAEKQAPFGKALSASMDQLKARIQAGNAELKGIQGELGNTGGSLSDLASKFGINIGEMAKLATGAATLKLGMEALKRTIESTEATHDTYARTVNAMDNVTNAFFTTLATGNFTAFTNGLQDIIDKANEAYNALDNFGSYMTRYNPNAGALRQQIQVLEQEARALKANGDIKGARAKLDEAQRLANQLKANTTQAGKMQTKAGYADLESLMKDAGATPTTKGKIAWYADPKNWDEVNKKAARYAELQKIINDATRESRISRKDGETVAGATMRQGEAARRKAQAEAELKRDASLNNAYVFQNLRDDNESEAGKRFNAALTNIYGNINAKAQNQGIDAQIKRLEGMMNKAAGSGGVSSATVELPKFDTSALTNDSFLSQFAEFAKQEYQKAQAELEKEAFKVGLTPELYLKSEDAIQGIRDKLQAMIDATQPLEIPVKSGDVTVAKDAKDTAAAWSAASRAISSAGSALQAIEDPGAKVAGILAQAVANIMLGFAQASASPATSAAGIFGWIAAITAGLATAVATVAQIKSVGAYAEGGRITGPSYTGDAVPIMANAGEVVLNASQQEMLAANLQSAHQNGGGGGRSTISGEQIVTVVNAYGRRTGRGEILR